MSPAPTDRPEEAVVRVKFTNKRQLERYYIRDISRNGIFLRTTDPRKLFETLVVVLELPDGETIELRGSVVHVVPPERATAALAPGMGVQFSDLTPEKRGKLESFIRRYRTIPGKVSVPPHATSRPATGKLPDAGGGADVGELLAAARRLLWLCADATVVAACDYYQLLGVEPGAPAEAIHAACERLRGLLDPESPPEGVDTHDPSRLSALALVLADIEDNLTDPRRRATYDAQRARR